MKTILKTLNSKVTLSTAVRYMIFILTCLYVVSPAVGQPLSHSPSEDAIGVYGGVGVTTLGPGLTAGVTARTGGHQFIFRGVSTDIDPAGETWEIAGLYGRVIALSSLQFSAGAGVGVVGGRGYSGFFATGRPVDLETMIGFPIEGRITWEPVRHAGIGFHSFANVNTVQPFGGVALTLHLGI